MNNNQTCIIIYIYNQLVRVVAKGEHVTQLRITTILPLYKQLVRDVAKGEHVTQLGITTILALYKQLARDVAKGDAGLTLVVYRVVSRRSVERGKHR